MLAKDVPHVEVTVSPLERRQAGQVAWLRCVGLSCPSLIMGLPCDYAVLAWQTFRFYNESLILCTLRVIAAVHIVTAQHPVSSSALQRAEGTNAKSQGRS